MGRPNTFTEGELKKKFVQYIEWNKSENKFYKRELLKGGERAGEIIDIELVPPLTIVGFCVYIKIHKTTFFDWINNVQSPLHNIAVFIREEIEQNQISGASLDLFNPSIVARLNGLNDTVNIESNIQPVINIALPNFAPNFAVLQENNIQDIEYNEVKPIELTELNTND